MSIWATGSAAAARWATRPASGRSRASGPRAGSGSRDLTPRQRYPHRLRSLRIDLRRLAEFDGLRIGVLRALVVHDHLREHDGEDHHDELDADEGDGAPVDLAGRDAIDDAARALVAVAFARRHRP